MRKFLPILLLMPLGAQAAGAATVFDGDAMVVAATPACATRLADFDIAAGTVLRSVLRPAASAPDDDQTRITVFHDSQAAFNVTFPELAGPSGTLRANGIGHSGEATVNWDLTYSNFTNIPTLESRSRQIRVSIRNFMFIRGCTVTLIGSYLSRTGTGATP